MKRREPIKLKVARSKLANLWLLGCLPPFLILTAQALFKMYGDDLYAVFGWFFPTVAPTLTLMFAVINRRALRQSDEEERHVEAGFFWRAWWISLVYLLFVTGTIVIASLNPPAIDTFSISGILLGPLQALTIGMIGVVFVTKTEQR